MHTVELLEQAMAAAVRLGYRLRHEWLGGSAGGSCEFNGQKWVFVDLALTVSEQLDQVIDAIRGDQGLHTLALSPELSHLVGLRKAA